MTIDLLFLVFTFPLAGFIILAFARGRMPRPPSRSRLPSW